MKKFILTVMFFSMIALVNSQEPKAIWDYKMKGESNEITVKDNGNSIVIKERNADLLKKEIIRDDKKIDLLTGKEIEKQSGTIKFNDDKKSLVQQNTFNGKRFFYPKGKDFYLMVTIVKWNPKENVKEDTIRIKAIKYNNDLSKAESFFDDEKLAYTIDITNFKAPLTPKEDIISKYFQIMFYDDLDMMAVSGGTGLLSLFKLSTGAKLTDIDCFFMFEIVPFKELKQFMFVDMSEDDIIFYNSETGKKENVLKINNFRKVSNYSIYSYKDYGDDTIFMMTENPNRIYKVDIKSAKVIGTLGFKAPSQNNMGVQLVRNKDISYIIYQGDNSPKNNGMIAVDLVNMKVLWEKEIPVSSVITPIFLDKDIILFDDNKIYKVDSSTGKEVWSKALKNIRFVNMSDDGFFIGFSDSKKIMYLKNRISITGFIKLDKDLQTVKYEYTGKSMITRIHMDGSKLYFTDESNLYTYDISAGKVINKFEFKSAGIKDYTASYMLPEKDRILLFTNKTIEFYDIKNNKIAASIPIKSDYLFFDIADLGTQILLTLLGPKVEEGVLNGEKQFYSKSILYLINKSTAKTEWVLDIGYYNSTDMIGFINYAVSGVDFFYKNIFKLSYKDNILIRSEKSSSEGSIQKLTAYKILGQDVKGIDPANVKHSFGINNTSSDPVISAKAAKGGAIFAGVLFAVIGAASGGTGSLLGSISSSVAGYSFESSMKSGDLVKVGYSVMKNFYRGYYNKFVEVK